MYIPVNCGGSAGTFRFWMGPCLSSSRFGRACTHYHVQASLASSLQCCVWRTQLSQSSSIQHHKQQKHHKLVETQRQIWAMFWFPGSFWISVPFSILQWPWKSMWWGGEKKVICKHRSSWNSTTVWCLSTQDSVKIELACIFRTHFDKKLLYISLLTIWHQLVMVSPAMQWHL